MKAFTIRAHPLRTNSLPTDRKARPLTMGFYSLELGVTLYGHGQKNCRWPMDMNKYGCPLVIIGGRLKIMIPGPKNILSNQK